MKRFLWLLVGWSLAIAPCGAQIATGPQTGGGTGQTAAQVTNTVNYMVSTNASVTAKAIGAYTRTFLPTMLPNLQLWLKADALGLADGTAVSSWTDFSGNARHAVQATGAKQPIYHVNRIGLLPALSFDNPMVVTTPSFLDGTYDKSFTYFQVAHKNGTSFRVSAVNGGTAFYAGRKNDLYEYDARAGVAIMDARAIDATATVVEGYRYDGTNRVIRINGVQILNFPDTTANGLSGVLNIGDTGGSFTWDGDIAEIILYNSILSDDDCRLVENYLTAKYSLQRGHLIFDGASNTEGFGASYANFAAYPIQCVTNLGGAPIWSGEIMGIPGQTIASILTNAPTRAYLANWTPNDVYICWAGDNDLGIGGATPATPALVYSQIVTNLSNARKAGLHTVVVSLLPGLGGSTDVNYEANRQIVNTMLRTNWQSFADAFDDAGADANIGVAGAPNNATYYQADKLHLTTAGSTIEANLAAAAIRSVFIPGANGYPAGDGTSVTNVHQTNMYSGASIGAAVTNGAAARSLAVYGHLALIGDGTSPTIVTNTGAGGGGSAAPTVTGCDSLMTVSAPSGSTGAIAGAAYATITFSKAFNKNPLCTGFVPINSISGAGTAKFYVNVTSTSTAQIMLVSGVTPTTSSTYGWTMTFAEPP